MPEKRLTVLFARLAGRLWRAGHRQKQADRPERDAASRATARQTVSGTPLAFACRLDNGDF